jgi:iron complex transport system substrate-binding protein
MATPSAGRRTAMKLSLRGQLGRACVLGLALLALVFPLIPAPVATASGAPTGPAFPVTVTSADGKVTIPTRPTRILSLSASATQMLYSIGAGKQVVGVDKYSTWPPGAPRTKFTGFETSAEDYLYLHPDLVIFAFSEGTLIKQLKLLGIPSLLLPPAQTFATVYQQIDELGLATGHEAAAEHLSASLAKFLASAKQRAGGAPEGLSYYIELSPDYYTATSKTFIGAEFSLFGMRDIADPASHGAAYPQISAEYLLKANPDYIFLADTVCCSVTPANFAKRPALSLLRAVKLHHVYGVNDSVASEWGPHTIEEFVSFLARVLEP